MSLSDHELVRQSGASSNHDIVRTADTQGLGLVVISSQASRSEDFTLWTMEQAFLVVCGGLVIGDERDEYDREVFTSKAVVQLAKVGLLPEISRDDVSERSKGDAVAKLIVCTQVSWFLIQSFARVAAKLPLTLLELHTMTHIACALIMYAIWWMKPYGIELPIVVDDPRSCKFARLLQRSSQYHQYEGPVSEEGCAVQYNGNIDNPSDEEHFNTSSESHDVMCDLRDRDCHFSCWLGCDNEIILTKGCENFLVEGNFPFQNGLSGRSDVGEDEENTSSSTASAATLLFSGLYGGSHLAAWTFHFPTSTEMWIWRICGIGMCTTPILVGLYWLLGYYYRKGTLDGGENYKLPSLICNHPWAILQSMFFFGQLYGFARMYILVECLVSLRSPANGTYETVAWTHFVPHF